MRICYDLRYASDHFPGIGTHAYQLLGALLEEDTRLDWDVLWNPAARQSRFDFSALQRHPRVTWRECGIATLGVFESWHLGRWLAQHPVDAYFSPYAIAPRGARCRVYITVHDVLPLRLPALFRWRTRWGFRAVLHAAATADVVFTDSAFSRDEILTLTSLPPARVRVAQPGAPTPLPEAEHRRPVELPDGPYALVVGANRPHKNLATLAAAWATFGGDAPLPLIGVGPHDSRFPGLAELAHASGAREVRELGRVSQGELAWSYAHATLVLFPSVYEGFGLPMAEAFLAGAPVIASDIPALREMGDGAARFVAPTDAQAWADAVRTLAADAPARAELTHAGQHRVASLTYRDTARSVLASLAAAGGHAA